MLQRMISNLMLIVLCVGSVLVITLFGGHFFNTLYKGISLFSWVWSPIQQQYGLGVPILGTLLTVCGSVLLMTPIAIVAALFFGVLKLPKWLRLPFDVILEIASSIPSIVYGVWAIWYFIPYLNKVFSDMTIYKGFLPALFILCVMVLPYMVGVMYFLYRQVPIVMIRQAYLLGGGPFDVLRELVFPYIGRSFFSVIFISMMKVLSETMIVLIVIGHAFNLSELWGAGGASLSSLLAIEWTNRVSPDHYHVLVSVAGLLLVLSYLCQYASRYFCDPKFKLPAVKGGL